jgi:glycerol-3-phosphate dehydrogenase (NAD(P)+)
VVVVTARTAQTATVAVLGAGSWGITLAWLVARAGHPVTLWSRNARKRSRLTKERNTGTTRSIELPEQVRVTGDLAVALASPLVVLAVQPDHARSLLKEAAANLRPDHRLVHVAKGFETGGTPLSRVIEQETRVLMVGALAGPIVPEELWRGEECAAVVGSRFQSLIDEATGLLGGRNIRIYGTRDLIGVEVGGAMRTPIAIAAGLLRGAGMGRALQAVVLTRGIAEGARLAEALGGERPTLSGLSGIGDWMLTTADPEDPLVAAGMAVAKGKPFKLAEGASRVRTLLGLAADRGIDLPITEAVGAILDGTPMQKALTVLMTRAARSEND